MRSADAYPVITPEGVQTLVEIERSGASARVTLVMPDGMALVADYTHRPGGRYTSDDVEMLSSVTLTHMLDRQVSSEPLAHQAFAHVSDGAPQWTDRAQRTKLGYAVRLRFATAIARMRHRWAS
jgi:hypothetical protein